MKRPTPFLSASLLIATSAAALQTSDPLPVVLQGDAVPGVGSIVSIEGVAVSERGRTFVLADTDADTGADLVVLQDGVLVLREDDPLPAPAGAVLGHVETIDASADGRLAWVGRVDGVGSADSVLFFDGNLVLRTGDASNAPGLTPGSSYRLFSDVEVACENTLLVVAYVWDVNLPFQLDRVLMQVQVDASGAVVSETLLSHVGQVLPGQTESIEGLSDLPSRSSLAAGGQYAFVADLFGDSSRDSVIYHGDVLLAQEGEPSMVPGRNWESVLGFEVCTNRRGDTVFSGRLDGTQADDNLIALNGAVWRREGDVLPAFAPGAIFTFGSSSPVLLSEAGEVAWHASLSVAGGRVLMVDEELIAQAGVTSIAGATLQSLEDVEGRGFHFTRNGRYVLFEGRLDDSRQGAFLTDRGLGTPFCEALPNSGGCRASIDAMGSAEVSANDLSLRATGVPPGVPGLFFFGTSQIQVPFGDGFRCAGGSVKRMPPPAFADAGGVATRMLDLTAPPLNTLATAGATLAFQYWYRDPSAGGAGFNLTDGLALSFE